MTPRLYRSLWTVASSPRSISGGMYAREPSNAPVFVSVAVSSAEASPKSINKTRPPAVIITFEGFTSRWITPRRCACSSPSATFEAMRAQASDQSPANSSRPDSVDSSPAAEDWATSRRRSSPETVSTDAICDRAATISSSREQPWTYSMAKYGTPFSSPTS